MSYLVHLQKFEGPLGLLLYLIRKEEMDIMDINIHEITRQYLEYIRMMKELDLEVAGEFVAMAATLLQIKSRMLLPSYNEEGEEVEQDDPRKELIQKLLEYQRYQEVGKQLYNRPLVNRDVWLRGTREDFNADQWGEIIIEEDGLFSLISSYRKAMKRMKRAVHQVREKVQSIAGRILEIKDRLIVGRRVLLSELITPGAGTVRVQLLITFLSILELGRMGFVHLFQNDTYGDIHIETTKPIERNVLERVQEFDNSGAEQVAQSIINEALETREEVEVLAAQIEGAAEMGVPSPQGELDLAGGAYPLTGLVEQPDSNVIPLVTHLDTIGDSVELAMGEEMMPVHGDLPLYEVGGGGGEERLAFGDEIASDEDILLAEQELELVDEDGSDSGGGTGVEIGDSGGSGGFGGGLATHSSSTVEAHSDIGAGVGESEVVGDFKVVEESEVPGDVIAINAADDGIIESAEVAPELVASDVVNDVVVEEVATTPEFELAQHDFVEEVAVETSEEEESDSEILHSSSTVEAQDDIAAEPATETHEMTVAQETPPVSPTDLGNDSETNA